MSFYVWSKRACFKDIIQQNNRMEHTGCYLYQNMLCNHDLWIVAYWFCNVHKEDNIYH